MVKPVSIDPNEQLPPSMDYETLLREGGDYARQFSEAIWTDYNHHDPGVTILEYLCFGITDLGYRASFPISDLLYARENKRVVPVNNAFFSPKKILPCAPLTVHDYRRLILDQIEEIQNVWVNPIEELQEKYKGLYDIQIQLNHEQENRINPEDLKKKIFALLSTHRNLGEDVRSIHLLEEEYLDLKIQVELNQDASVEQVLAEMIHRLESFLNPKIKFQSFEEKLADGMDINTLLDGPKSERGYIDPSHLHHLPTAIYKSQIHNTLVAISGIRSLQSFEIWRYGFPYNKEEISIPKNTYIVLDEGLKNWGKENYPITFIRNNYPVIPNPNFTEQQYKIRVAKNSQYFSNELILKQQITHSDKDLQEIGTYYSIQRFFPQVYGIGTYGLPSHADSLRQAQARQLKGYLAIFETLFASFLKQLTQVKYLFSIERKSDEKEAENNVLIDLKKELEYANALNLQKPYAFQLPTDIPDFDNLIDSTNLKSMQNQEVLTPHGYESRYNEFLDHLLARFGETFQGDWLYKFLNNPADIANSHNSLINTKYRILQEYEQLSLCRGMGFNYLQKDHVEKKRLLWEGDYYDILWSKNVSGLKKRLCYWLNLHDYSDHELTQFFPFKNLLLAAPEENDPHKSTAIPFDSLLRYGQTVDHYVINNHGYQPEIFFKGTGDKEFGPLFKANDLTHAEQWLTQFVASVNAFDQYCKSFFVVEHILLRPMCETGSKLLLEVGKIISLQNADSSNPTETLPSFYSLKFSSTAELDGIAEDIISICKNKENYEFLLEEDNYFILIKQNGLPILMSDTLYTTKEEAETISGKVVNKFEDLLISLNNNPESIGSMNTDFSNWSGWLSTESGKPHINEDLHFFAPKISILIPNWPSIFMEAGFEPLFHQILMQHIPTHIQADVYWLDWEEMSNFEKVYFEWLQVKSSANATSEEIDLKSSALINQLKLQKETHQEIKADPINSVPGDPEHLKLVELAQKPLSQSRFETIFGGDKLYLLLKPADLQIIEGIDVQIEYILKREKINTWTSLQYANEEKLQKILFKAGKMINITEILSWIVQAELLKRDDGLIALRNHQLKTNAETAIDKVARERRKSWFGY